MRPLVLIAFLLALVIQRFAGCHGMDMCLDNTWRYFYHTHSCFKLFSTTPGTTWNESKNACETFQGHLATITDNETNNFIINTFFTVDNYNTWIGLHRTSSDKNGKQWLWTGFPNKQTNSSYFTDSRIKKVENLRTYKPDHGAVYITQKKWQTGYLSWRYRYLCEHASVSAIPEIQTSCPLSPAKANQRSVHPRCRFLIKGWTYVRWRPRNQFNTSDPDCWSTTCEQSAQYIKASDNETGYTTVTYRGNLTRQQEGEWMCEIKRFVFNTSIPIDNEIMALKTCQVKIYAMYGCETCSITKTEENKINVFEMKCYRKKYENTMDIKKPADNLQCETQLKPDSLFIWCRTKKIYPQGLCKLWISRKGRDGDFESIGQNMNVASSPHQINSEPIYFQSNCSQDLTSLIPSISGDVNITVRMYPNVTGFDLSNTTEAYKQFTQEISIAPPERPIFYLYNDKIEQSSLTLSANQVVEMNCVVGAGRPAVISTIVDCGFSFDESKTTSISQIGNLSTTIRLNASNDINGKTCSCWGDHITGKTDTTTVTFFMGSRGHSNGQADRTLTLIAAGGGTLLVIVAITIITVVCCVRCKRQSREKDQQDETSRDENAPDGLPVYAKVKAKPQAKANNGPQVSIDDDSVLFINDLYYSHGDVKEDVENGDGKVACSNSDENEKDELFYANTSSVSNSTTITGADDKTAASDVNKSSAKQRRRANELAYVEVEFDQTTSGSDRKIKVKSGDHKVDYACIDFQRTSAMSEEIAC